MNSENITKYSTLDGKKYAIPESMKQGFLQDFPDAVEYKEESTQQIIEDVKPIEQVENPTLGVEQSTEDEQFNFFVNSLPKEHRDTTDFKLKRYWELNNKPQDFSQAIDRNMYKKMADGYHANSVAYNKEKDEYEFMKNKSHPTIKKEIDWYNSDNPDAKKFREDYVLLYDGNEYKYIPRNPKTKWSSLQPTTDVEFIDREIGEFERGLKSIEDKTTEEWLTAKKEEVKNQGIVSIISQLGGRDRFGSLSEGTLNKIENIEIQQNSDNISSAYKLINDTKTKLEATKNNSGFWKGLSDNLFSIDALTAGFSEIEKNKSLQNVISKMDRVGMDNLNESEIALLDAAAINAAANMLSHENIDAYSIGAGVGEAVPYMVQFALTRVPVSGAVGTVGKGVLRFAAKRFPKMAGKQLATTGVKGALNKGGLWLGKTIPTAAIQPLLSPSAYVDLGNRSMEITPEVEGGDIKIGNVSSQSNAILKAYGASVIENFSEASGVLLAKPLGAMFKGIASNAPKFAKFLDSWNKYVRGSGMQSLSNAVGYNGAPGEFFEEMLSGQLNALTVGDMTTEDLYSLDNMMHTASVTGAVSLGMSLLGLGVNIPIAYKTNRDYRKADELLSGLDSNPDYTGIPQEIRDAISQNNDKTISNIRQGIFNILQEKYSNGDVAGAQSAKEALKTVQTYVEAAKRREVYLAVKETEVEKSLVDKVNEIFAANPTMTREQAEQAAEPIVEQELQQEQAEMDAMAQMGDIPATIEQDAQEHSEYINSEYKEKSNTDTGEILTATYEGKKVFVTSGAVVLDENGDVDLEKTSHTLTILDDEGNKEMVSPSKITEPIIIYQQDFVDNLNAEPFESSNGVLFYQNRPIAVKNANGQFRYLFNNEETDFLNANGQPTENIVLPTEEDVINYYNNLVMQQQTPPIQQTEDVQAPTGEQSDDAINNIPQSPTSETGAIQEQQEQNGNIPTTDGSLEGSGIADAPSQQYPLDKKGNLDFDSFTPAQLFQYTTETDGVDIALEDARAEIETINAEIAKIDAKIGKARAKDKIALREQRRVLLSELQEWQAVSGVAENAIQEETVVEQQENIQPQLDVQDNTVSETEIDPIEEDTFEFSFSEEYPQEPQTIDEMAAAMLSGKDGLKLLQESYKKELGVGKEEARKMFGLFARKEKGGISIERAGEMVEEAWVATDRFYNNDMLSNEIGINAGRNAIIEVLTQARTKKDINQYIRRAREQAARRDYDAEIGYYEGLEQMQKEQQEAYNEYLDQQAKLFAEEYEINKTEIDNIFAEAYLQEKEFYEEIDEILNENGSRTNNIGSVETIDQTEDESIPTVPTASNELGGIQDESTISELGERDTRGEQQGETTGVSASTDVLGAEENTRETTEVSAELEQPQQQVDEITAKTEMVNGVIERMGISGVDIITDVSQLPASEQTAIDAINRGVAVKGWFNTVTGKAYVYAPNADSEQDVEATILHEVIAHKGLRELLGEENFNQLLDNVWLSMSQDARNEMIRYVTRSNDPKTIVNAKKSKQKRQAAADEYIARMAEGGITNPTVWETIKQFVKDFIASIGITTEVTDADIMNLLRASKANLRDRRITDIIANANEVMFRIKAKDINNTIFGIHNLSQSNLSHAIKMGGLANPSLGIIDKSVSSFDSFGDISLIAPSSLIESKTGRNIGTWQADAYTPRYPSISYIIPKKSMDYIRNKTSVLDKNMRSYAISSIQEEIERGGIRYLHENGYIGAIFLQEKGLLDYSYMKNSLPPEMIENNKDLVNINTYSYQNEFSPEQKKRILSLYKEYVDWDIQKMVSKFKEDEGLEGKLRRMIFDNGEIKEDSLYDFIRILPANIRDYGKIDPQTTAYNARDKIRNDESLKEEYFNFVENFYDKLNVEEKIFLGYTNLGKRRYTPHTLENVSKIMKKEGKAGGENFGGMGQARASLLRPLKTLQQISKNKDKIVSKEKFEDIKDKLQDIYIQLTSYTAISDKYDSGREYRLEEALSKQNPKKYLKDEYDIDITDTENSEIKEFAGVLKDMPTEYFETKFERPVSVSEFSGAVIPIDTDTKIKDYLSEINMPFVEYGKDNRTDITNKFVEDLNKDNSILFRTTEPTAEEQQIEETAKQNGTYLKAPNGAETNLSPQQWTQVRTKAFKDWFGDWETDPQNASKVVDVNGEPLVVYHTTDKDFSVFDRMKSKGGFFFSPNRDRLDVYNKSKTDAYFLDIKNPYNNNVFDKDIESFYDGVMDFGNIKDKEPQYIYEIIAFYPTQIKSATDNTGEFSAENADIRFRMSNKESRDNTTYIDPNSNIIPNNENVNIKMFRQHSPAFQQQIESNNGDIFVLDYSRKFNHTGDNKNKGNILFFSSSEKGANEYMIPEDDYEGREKTRMYEYDALGVKLLDLRVPENRGKLKNLIDALIKQSNEENLSMRETYSKEIEQSKQNISNKKDVLKNKRNISLFEGFLDKIKDTTREDIINNVKKSNLSIWGQLASDYDNGVALRKDLELLGYDGFVFVEDFVDAQAEIGILESNKVNIFNSDIQFRIGEDIEKTDIQFRYTNNPRDNRSQDFIQLDNESLKALSPQDAAQAISGAAQINNLIRFRRKEADEDISKIANEMLTEEQLQRLLDKTNTAIQSAENRKLGKRVLSIMDNKSTIKDLQDFIIKQGGTVPDALNAYYAENRSASIAQDRIGRLNANYVEPLANIVFELTNKETKQEKQEAQTALYFYTLGKTGLERQKVKDAEERQKAEDKWNKENEERKAEDKEPLPPLKHKFSDYAGLTGLQISIIEKSGIELSEKQKEMSYNELVDFAKENEVPTIEEYVEKYEDDNPITSEMWDILNDISDIQLRGKLDGNLITLDVYHTLMYGKPLQEVVNENIQNGSISEDSRKVTSLDTPQSLLEDELITEEQKESLCRKYKFYLPLKGRGDLQAEDINTYSGGKRMGSSKFKAIKGHTNLTHSPIEQLITDTMQSIIIEEKNAWKLKLLRLLQNNPNSDKYVVAKTYVVPIEVEEGETTYRMATEAEILSGLAVIQTASMRLDTSIEKWNMDEHKVAVFDRGMLNTITFANPKIAQQINYQAKRNDGEWLTRLMFIVSRLNRMWASLLTSYNLSFIPINLIRDMQESFFTVGIKSGAKAGFRQLGKSLGVGSNLSMSFLRRVRQGAKFVPQTESDRIVDLYFKYGAPISFNQMPTYTDIQNDLSKMVARKGSKRRRVGKGLVNFLKAIQDLSEGISRIVAFEESIKRGESIEQAVWNAKEVSVNFDKKGEQSNFFGVFQLFWNAMMQSNRKQYLLFKENPKRTAVAMAVATSTPFIRFLMNALLEFFYDDEERELEDVVNEFADKYFSISKYTRRMSNTFIFGDNIISIPAPYALHPFTTLGEYITELSFKGLNDKDKTDFALDVIDVGLSNIGGDFIAQMLISATSEDKDFSWSSIAPEITTPFIEVSENKDFAGRPIYRDTPYNKDMPAYTKAYKKTNKLVVDAAEWLNSVSGGDYATKGFIDLNPAAIQHVFNALLGGAYRFPAELANTVALSFDAKATLGDAFSAAPVINRGYKGTIDRAVERSMQDMYFDMAAEYENYNLRMREYKKQGDEESMTALSNEVGAIMLEFEKVNRQIDRINKAKRKYLDFAKTDEAEKDIHDTYQPHLINLYKIARDLYIKLQGGEESLIDAISGMPAPMMPTLSSGNGGFFTQQIIDANNARKK